LTLWVTFSYQLRRTFVNRKAFSQALCSRNILAIIEHLLVIACGDGKMI
jgi:hypothetical protein